MNTVAAKGVESGKREIGPRANYAFGYKMS